MRENASVAFLLGDFQRHDEYKRLHGNYMKRYLRAKVSKMNLLCHSQHPQMMQIISFALHIQCTVKARNNGNAKQLNTEGVFSNNGPLFQSASFSLFASLTVQKNSLFFDKIE